MPLRTGTAQDIQSSRRAGFAAPSFIWINDGFAAATSGGAMGIIQQQGIIPVAGGTAEVPGTDTKFFLVHTANGTVTTYEVLATSPATGALQTDACSSDTFGNCIIEEWATNAGTMNGKSINTGQTMNLSISAKRDTASSEETHIDVLIYHRTTGGTETLLDTVVFGELTTSFADYTGTWEVSSDQAFGTNELLVIKIKFFNTGVPV